MKFTSFAGHSAAFLYLILKKNTAVRYLLNLLRCMFMIHRLQLQLEFFFPFYQINFFKFAHLVPCHNYYNYMASLKFVPLDIL